MGMKNLFFCLCFWVGFALSAEAASPSYQSFIGAGTVTIVSNPPSGTIVITGSGGSSGPTTNAPPYTASLGGTGNTNLIIDWIALGPTNEVRITATANFAIVHTNVIDGKNVTVETIQDATGNRTATTNPAYPPNTRFGIEITGFALSTNATYRDLLKFHGSFTNAQVSGNLRGFAP
jgi:hypothetical protein